MKWLGRGLLAGSLPVRKPSSGFGWKSALTVSDHPSRAARAVPLADLMDGGVDRPRVLQRRSVG
jgi:hypothetical protein